MKKLAFILSISMLLGLASLGNATLWDRGGGLIYDDYLEITWLQNANYGAGSSYDNGSIRSSTTDGLMTWANAMAWAANLTYYDSVRGVSYDDWRLPTTSPEVGGYNITSSEMGYMFYVNLGNKGYYDTSGNYVGDGNWGLKNISFIDGTTGQARSFQNLQAYFYWSYTEYSNPQAAWSFSFYRGSQGPGVKPLDYAAWAVRPGDVVSAPVPEPATMLLLGLGLVGLAGVRRKLN